VKHLVAVGLQLAFYATPVIYQVELVPKRQEVLGVELPLRALYELNPMTAFIGAYRNVLYDLRFPAALDLLYLTAWAVGALWVGWRVFAHFEPRLAEEL
jgi:ABC-type polysaccharide/polyol phosphate export permease